MRNQEVTDFDVVIVGGGPAGMFATKRLAERDPTLRLLLLDKGKSVENRLVGDVVPFGVRDPRAQELVSGAGGAGLFSDGKLTLTLSAGGKLASLVSDHRANHYVKYIEENLLRLDGVSVVNPAQIANGDARCVIDVAREHGLTYKPLPIRHFGSDALKRIVARFFDDLQRHRVALRFEHGVLALEPQSHRLRNVLTIRTSAGSHYRVSTRYVVFAVGKEGSIWLAQQLATHGVASHANRVYFGVRIETTSPPSLTRLSFDPKFSCRFADGTKMKTHCFCRRGEILPLRYYDLPTAGSHTRWTERQDPRDAFTPNSNAVFGVLLGDSPEQRVSVQTLFATMKNVSHSTNGELMVQRYDDFRGRRATARHVLAVNSIQSIPSAIPGNIANLVMPLNFNEKLDEFLYRLSAATGLEIPGDALLYAPAIEWWMPRIETSSDLETGLRGVYAVGDGAGISQGITYAATTGLVAADSILSHRPA